MHRAVKMADHEYATPQADEQRWNVVDAKQNTFVPYRNVLVLVKNTYSGLPIMKPTTFRASRANFQAAREIAKIGNGETFYVGSFNFFRTAEIAKLLPSERILMLWNERWCWSLVEAAVFFMLEASGGYW